MRHSLYVFVLALTIPLLAHSQPEPTYDHDHPNGSATYTKDNVWHLNMELICPYTGGGTPGLEYGQAIGIGGGEYIVSHDYSTGELLLVDVTDPRSAAVALRISAKSTYTLYDQFGQPSGTYPQANSDIGSAVVCSV